MREKSKTNQHKSLKPPLEQSCAASTVEKKNGSLLGWLAWRVCSGEDALSTRQLLEHKLIVVSPLPANIYFPAIPTLSNVFEESVESINLTVTVYLAMQGVCMSDSSCTNLSRCRSHVLTAPMVWGPLSDKVGRRPVFILCFILLVGSSIGLALTPPSAFWLLLLLRAFQAGGCASTIALGMCCTWIDMVKTADQSQEPVSLGTSPQKRNEEDILECSIWVRWFVNPQDYVRHLTMNSSLLALAQHWVELCHKVWGGGLSTRHDVVCRLTASGRYFGSLRYLRPSA